MNHNLAEASDFIRHHLEHGFSEQEIRRHFQAHGWSSKWIDEAFDFMGSDRPGAPRKYRVFRAINDFFEAIGANPRAYFSALGLTALAFVAGIFLFSALIGALPPHDSEASPGGVESVLTVAVILYFLLLFGWYVTTTVFFMSMGGFALAEGRRRRHITVKRAFKRAIRHLPRTVAATAIGFIITFLPLILLVIYYAVTAIGGVLGQSALAYFLPLLISVSWIIIASLRLSLVQQVAFFEPDLPLRQVFGRSSYLLRKGGQWFIIKGVLLLNLLAAVLAAFNNGSIVETNAATDLAFLIMSLVAQGTLTMLYLNRAVVRGHTR